MRRRLESMMFRRTRCDTALPRISCSTGPIRVRFRLFSDTATFPRHRFIHTSPICIYARRTIVIIPGLEGKSRSMFMINEPTDEDVKNFIFSQRDLQFTYSEVGATNSKLPAEGFTIDHNQIQL